MKIVFVVIACLLLGPVARLNAAVEHDSSIPQVAFAAEELEKAIREAGHGELHVVLSIHNNGAAPESFEIRKPGPDRIEIRGADPNGAMYGGIEVAEHIKLGLPIENVKREPFVEKRGLKINIPWDARTPSYCDKGSAAQNNIVNVWDFEGFWKPYFDDLARYRYNVVSLWSTHPYPSLLKVHGYADCAMVDVYRVKEEILHPKFDGKIRPDLDANGDGEVTPDDGTMTLVKSMTIEEKTAHWQQVFQHAEDRGLEIYLFHWNVYVNGSEGKYGITPDQTNPATIKCIRACVKEALLTYADVLESHYKTSLHAKTGWFRWHDTLKSVEDEVERIVGEGAVPVIEFTGLSDGDRFEVGADVEVRLEVSASSGVEEVRLCLNGLVLEDPDGKGPYAWNGSTDEQLNDLREDWYSLEAFAVDRDGFVTRQEIYIQVGDDPGPKDDWKLDTHAVILNDGQKMNSGHGETEEEAEDDQVTIKFKELEGKFQFDSTGKVKLRDDFLGVTVFKSRSKADPGPRLLEFKDGAFTTYNLVEPVSVLWSSRKWDVDEQRFKDKLPAEKGFEGPYELVVTRGKMLAVVGTKNGRRQVVWHAEPDYEDWTGRFE